MPIGPAINTLSKETFDHDVSVRDAKAKSLAEEQDLSWLVEGALAYLKHDMEADAPTKGEEIGKLRRAYYGEKKYPAGMAVIFSEAQRKTVTLSRGPARIIQHTWVTSDGNKYIVALNELTKDQP